MLKNLVENYVEHLVKKSFLENGVPKLSGRVGWKNFTKRVGENFC